MLRLRSCASSSPLPFQLLVALLLAVGCSNPSDPLLPLPDPSAVGSKVPAAAHCTFRASRTSGIVADGKDTVAVELIVRNAANEPLPGLDVQVFLNAHAVFDPQREFSTFPAVTDAAGSARGILATTVSGVRRLSATVTSATGDPGTSARVVSPFEVEFVAGPPVALRLYNQMGAQVAGEPFSPQLGVELEDAFGNGARPSNQVVTLSIASGPPGATLSGPTTLVLGTSLPYFASAYLTLAGDGYVLRVSTPGLQSAETTPFRVEPAAAARLAFLDEPTDVVAGEPLPTLRVAHYDRFGNLATGASNWVSLRLLPQGSGAPMFGESNQSVREGISEFQGLAIHRAGVDYQLEARNDPSTPALSRTFRVLPGAASATTSTLEAAPGRVLADGASPSTLTLRVRDAFGNVVPDAPVQFLVSEGDGLLTEAANRTSASGAASVRLTSAQPGRVNVSAQVGGTVMRQYVRFARACSVQVGLPGLPAAPFGPVAVADFDADGNLDLVGTTSTGVQVARGLGDGTFGTPQPFTGYGQPTGVVAGDLDGDGAQDLVLFGTGFTVLRGNGDGSFRAPESYVEYRFSAPTWVGLADVNGDNLPDLLQTDLVDRGLGVRLNVGGGRLGENTVWASPAGAPVIHDLNRDGRADLLFTDYDGGAVKVLRGRAGGGFEPEVSYPAGERPQGIRAGDMDGDGDEDLLVLRQSAQPALLRQQPDGSFVVESTAFVPRSGTVVDPYPVSLGDVDGDGDLDAAFGDDYRDSVRMFRNDGTGHFTETAEHPHRVDSVTKMRFADLTHDGRPELLMSSGDVLLNLGDGSLLSPPTFTTAPYTRHLIVDDWDADGRLDLVTVGNSTGVHWGLTGGAFDVYGSISSQTSSAAVSADFDGDGRPELVLARDWTPRLDFYEVGNGRTFFAPVAQAVDRATTALDAADLDGDGLSDLVLANEQAGVVQVLRNGQSAGFTPSAAYAVGAGPTGLTAADLDGDGRLDLVVSRRNARRVTVLLAQADGGYGAPVDVAPGGLVGQVVAADLSGDGVVDLAVAISEVKAYALALLIGRGDGSFAPAQEILLPTNAVRLEAGDLNGDGAVDLVAIGGSVQLLLGDGDGTFAPPIGYARGLELGTGALADFDGDGRLDVVGVREMIGGSSIAVMRNRCLR